jgi:hypothetical protein
MSNRLQFIGMHVTRYGLVLVLLWIGGMKFTAYEAEGIRPLVANSPLMGWVYNLMSVTAFSSLLGVVEIAIGVLIALRPMWPAGSALGSGLAVGSRPCRRCRGSSCSKTSCCWVPRCGRPARHGQRGRFRPAHETPDPYERCQVSFGRFTIDYIR